MAEYNQRDYEADQRYVAGFDPNERDPEKQLEFLLNAGSGKKMLLIRHSSLPQEYLHMSRVMALVQGGDAVITAQILEKHGDSLSHSGQLQIRGEIADIIVEQINERYHSVNRGAPRRIAAYERRLAEAETIVIQQPKPQVQRSLFGDLTPEATEIDHLNPDGTRRQ